MDSGNCKMSHTGSIQMENPIGKIILVIPPIPMQTFERRSTTEDDHSYESEKERDPPDKKVSLMYKIKLFNFLLSLIAFCAAYPRSINICNNNKNDCSGYANTTCVVGGSYSVCSGPDQEGITSQYIDNYWDLDNCTLWDLNTNVMEDSITFYDFLTSKANDGCTGNISASECPHHEVLASCAEYCDALHCGKGWLLASSIIFILFISCPMPEGSTTMSTVSQVLEGIASGITSVATKISRLAVEAYLTQPNKLFYQIWLAAELMVSAVLLCAFTFCCSCVVRSCCEEEKVQEGNYTNDKVNLMYLRFAQYRRSILLGRMGSSFWVIMVSMIVIASSNNSASLFYVWDFDTNPAAALSVITVFVQALLEAIDFIRQINDFRLT